ASMEVSTAWNDQGLCIAALVHDNELINDQPDDLLWQRDCIELFVDGRIGERFMKPPYSPGAYQLFIKPPLAGKPPVIAVNPRDGKIEGLKIAGKPTASGFVVECIIPWTAFPAFAAWPPQSHSSLHSMITIPATAARPSRECSTTTRPPRSS
ncbi:MAG TPA: sugar-binding protein, partial [Planctomycetota bacterium]|nr:sugar-binding protein [Planctomycetota bacterium]